MKNLKQSLIKKKITEELKNVYEKEKVVMS